MLLAIPIAGAAATLASKYKGNTSGVLTAMLVQIVRLVHFCCCPPNFAHCCCGLSSFDGYVACDSMNSNALAVENKWHADCNTVACCPARACNCKASSMLYKKGRNAIMTSCEPASLLID